MVNLVQFLNASLLVYGLNNASLESITEAYPLHSYGVSAFYQSRSGQWTV